MQLSWMKKRDENPRNEYIRKQMQPSWNGKRERMREIEKPLNEQTLLQDHSQMKSLDFLMRDKDGIQICF